MKSREKYSAIDEYSNLQNEIFYKCIISVFNKKLI